MNSKNLHRRQLLLTAGSAAGVHLSEPRLRAQGLAEAPALASGRNINDRIRAAVVGCRSRGRQLLECLHQLGPSENVEEGHKSAALAHLGNISYRLGRAVQFDPEKERFTDDEAANRLLKREYRAPYVVPEEV